MELCRLYDKARTSKGGWKQEGSLHARKACYHGSGDGDVGNDDDDANGDDYGQEVDDDTLIQKVENLT